MGVFSSHILLLSTDGNPTWLPSAGEMKLLIKSSEVPLRLEVRSISLLQGKAGVAESFALRLLCYRVISSVYLKGGCKEGGARLCSVVFCDGIRPMGANTKFPWNIRICFLHCLISTGAGCPGELWSLPTWVLYKSILDTVVGRFLEVALCGQWG